ncbi:MAG: hypothetical protein LBR31_09185 [Desulfovibrio sp.]|jgi:intracellular multiplication protein IcmB|nr:hypothetical protein [Desulfovibrio sp.]
MLDGIVNGMDRGVRALSEAFAGPVGSYCRLETVDNGAIVADDGSLITVLRLEGSLKHVGMDEYAAIVSGLTEKLQSAMSKPGHLLQVVFDYDPESSKTRVAESFTFSMTNFYNFAILFSAARRITICPVSDAARKPS